ncbi:MAG: cupin domain-containing protein [Flavobacteriaceae bacterium]
MTFTDLNQLELHEIVKGFKGRFVHSKNMTVSFWQIDKGAILPEHSHPEEQISIVTKGQLKLTIAGETQIVSPGMVVVIPSNVIHKGEALTYCEVIDIFSPARDDYKF